jgi:hypothetical protein
MQVQNVVIRPGLGGDLRYYLGLGDFTVVASKSSLLKIGLAFYHVAIGNWGVDASGIGVDVDDLTVYVVSSESSVLSNRQFSDQSSTPRWVVRLVFNNRMADLVLSLFERWLGLAVVCVADLAL